MAKNTHLTHIEDLLVDNGSAGGFKAIEYLSSIVDMLAGQTSGPLGMQAKFDGAPAIICGIHPETKRFFVGTKSVFNKTPKVNYTDADIQRNHSGGLVDILKVCLAHLPKLGIKTILQGDLAFIQSQLQSKTIDGKGYTTFQPNTILYAIPAGSDLDKTIRKAKMGIMFHTEYKGPSIQELTASFNPNMKSLKPTKDVWFKRTNFTVADAVTLNAKETQHMRDAITSLARGVQNHKKFLDFIAKDKELGRWLNQYFNREVRQNAIGQMSAKRFHDYVQSELQLKSGKLKTREGQEKRRAEDEQFLSLYADQGFQKSLDEVLTLHQMFGQVKRRIVRKLESINDMPMFVADKDGYRVTAPEGFVAIDNVTNDAVKLVDRLEFSRNNFLAAKNWVKENQTLSTESEHMKSLKKFLSEDMTLKKAKRTKSPRSSTPVIAYDLVFDGSKFGFMEFTPPRKGKNPHGSWYIGVYPFDASKGTSIGGRTYGTNTSNSPDPTDGLRAMFQYLKTRKDMQKILDQDWGIDLSDLAPKKAKIQEDNLSEVTAKKKVRMLGGKRVIQWRCPSGYDKQGKNCKKRSGADALKRKRSAKIGARKRKATKAQANLKRQRSMKRRRSMNIR